MGIEIFDLLNCLHKLLIFFDIIGNYLDGWREAEGVRKRIKNDYLINKRSHCDFVEAKLSLYHSSYSFIDTLGQQQILPAIFNFSLKLIGNNQL